MEQNMHIQNPCEPLLCIFSAQTKIKLKNFKRTAVRHNEHSITIKLIACVTNNFG